MKTSSSTKPLKKVMFCTDFSQESASAVPYLKALGDGCDKEVYVVHVMDLFPYALGHNPAAVKKRQQIRHRAEERMQQFIKVHQLENRRFKPALLSGEAFKATDEFARAHEVDLILLGSSAKLGVARLFSGSVAEEIFRTAKVPVMVVGPNASPPGSSSRFQHVLFPTDMSHVSKSALPYLEACLQEDQSSRVILAHFPEANGLSMYDQHQLRRRTEAELRELLSSSLRAQVADVIVEFASPGASIAEIARMWAADLIILGVRYGGAFTRAATHGLPSMTLRLIHESPCPVLTVRSSGPR